MLRNYLLIAWPVGYLAVSSWLVNFAYRTSLTVPMFLGAGLTVFLIAAAVISFRTYRAAAANPADSMRYESKTGLSLKHDPEFSLKIGVLALAGKNFLDGMANLV